MPEFEAYDRPSILTLYLTGRRDPQRFRRQPTNRYDNIRPWYETMRECDLHGLIFHDRLSADLIATHATPRIRFVRVPAVYERSTNDHRMFICDRVLARYTAPAVFMTDLFDVAIARDPFAMLEPGRVYVGDDGGTLGSNVWLRDLADRIGDERYLTLLDELADAPTLNAGILGGATADVREFVGRMIEEFNRIARPWHNSDMLAFNYVGYTFFRDRVSQALCSRFKQYESHRTDVPFIHK